MWGDGHVSTGVTFAVPRSVRQRTLPSATSAGRVKLMAGAACTYAAGVERVVSPVDRSTRKLCAGAPANALDVRPAKSVAMTLSSWLVPSPYDEMSVDMLSW